MAIWLTEVASNTKIGKAFLEHLANANNDANPGLSRLVLNWPQVRVRPPYGHADRVADD